MIWDVMLINGVNVGSSSRLELDVISMAIMEHYGALYWHYNHRNLGVMPADQLGDLVRRLT